MTGRRRTSKIVESRAGRQTSQPIPRNTGVRRAGRAGNAAMAAMLGVAIHDDGESKREADALGASAFTRGGEIFLGTIAPPLDSAGGRELLGHELAHVMQQRDAGGGSRRAVNQPGDAFEAAAESGSAAPGGTPAAVQRQMADPKLAYRTQIETAIRSYLETMKSWQGGTLHLTEDVKTVLLRLAQAPGPHWKGPGPDPKTADRFIKLTVLLNSMVAPLDPATLAVRVAEILPDPMDPAVLAQMAPLSSGPKPQLFDRVKGAIVKTTPTAQMPQPDIDAQRVEAAQNQSVGEHGAMKQKPPVSQSLGPQSGERAPDQADAPVKPADNAVDRSRLAAASAQVTRALQTQRGSAVVKLRLYQGTLSAEDLAKLIRDLEQSLPRVRELRPDLLASVQKIDVYAGDQVIYSIFAGGQR